MFSSRLSELNVPYIVWITVLILVPQLHWILNQRTLHSGICYCMGNRRKRPAKFNLPGGPKAKGRSRKRCYSEVSDSDSDLDSSSGSDSDESDSPGWYQATHNDKDLKVSLQKSSPKLQGGEEYRVINLNKLSHHLQDTTLHAARCPKAHKLARKGKSPIQFLGVTHDMGLACLLWSVCKGCHRKFSVRSSPMMSTKHNRHFEVNVRAVWGEVSSGGGHAKLNERLCTMGMPAVSGDTFKRIEEEVGCWWQESLEADMLEAGNEERQLAIEANSFCEGVPAIAVVADGGWSKRSHKHSYNAAGGVAIVVGARTGKLLHVGMRNKRCAVCTDAARRHTPPREHQCAKNWDKASQSMEADILLDAFLKCESVHGVRYTTLIGDGDSSVLSVLENQGPPWRRFIEKTECANHMCKNVRSKLEKLVAEKSFYKYVGDVPDLVNKTATKRSSEPSTKPTRRSPKSAQHQERSNRQQFLHASISHEWLDHKGTSEWWKGKVMNIVKGKDGLPGAVYEVVYEEEGEEPCIVDHLIQDYQDGSVRIL